jgi:hypothetical protein
MWVWIIVGLLMMTKLSSIGLPGTVIALIIVLSVICKCRDNYEDKSRRNRWWN